MIHYRIDDFPGCKPEEFYRHNLENFKKFDICFKELSLSYVLGAIPHYTEDDHLEWFAEQNNIQLAIHGIDHDERFPNEFREWETAEDIAREFMNIKQRFESSVSYKIEHYIPPHNIIDLKTCKALKTAAINNLLVGPGTGEKEALKAKEMGLNVFWSQFPHFYGRTDEMLACGATGEICKRIESGEDFFVTLHFPWELNISPDFSFKTLRQFLREIHASH